MKKKRKNTFAFLLLLTFLPFVLNSCFTPHSPRTEPSIPGLEKDSAMDFGRDRDSGSESDRDREDMDDDDSDSEDDSEEERDEGGDGDQRMSIDRQDDEREREEDRDRSERHAGECLRISLARLSS